jgi:hypothetical protein
LIAGGGNYPLLPWRAEIYHSDTGTFTETGEMISPPSGHMATPLADGTVLIAGGAIPGPTPVALAEIYHPIVNNPAPVLLTNGAGEAAILHASTQQIVSRNVPAAAGESLEIFMTGLIDGSVIPPQVFIGGRIAELLFFGNAPEFLGLNQVNVRVPEGITPGSAVPVRLSYLARSSNEVTVGVK